MTGFRFCSSSGSTRNRGFSPQSSTSPQPHRGGPAGRPTDRQPKLGSAVRAFVALENNELRSFCRPVRSRPMASTRGLGHTDLEPLGSQDLVEPRRCRPLLASGPAARLGQQDVTRSATASRTGVGRADARHLPIVECPSCVSEPCCARSRGPSRPASPDRLSTLTLFLNTRTQSSHGATGHRSDAQHGQAEGAHRQRTCGSGEAANPGAKRRGFSGSFPSDLRLGALDKRVRLMGFPSIAAVVDCREWDDGDQTRSPLRRWERHQILRPDIAPTTPWCASAPVTTKASTDAARTQLPGRRSVSSSRSS